MMYCIFKMLSWKQNFSENLTTVSLHYLYCRVFTSALAADMDSVQEMAFSLIGTSFAQTPKKPNKFNYGSEVIWFANRGHFQCSEILIRQFTWLVE